MIHNSMMVDATNALTALCQTSRRLNEITTPYLYREPFRLLGYGFNRQNIQYFYDLVELLSRDNGLADMVQIFEE